MSGNEGVAVPTEFDEKAVYVIDGPDGISQVVASAEELQVTLFDIYMSDQPFFLILFIKCFMHNFQF